ncbi:MAG: TRAP transporter substrate-binding protein [Deltaproteobacteria bacterium]|nr:TRAP transporter substrate-binding protein [Deltaproteobacteria bacterium]
MVSHFLSHFALAGAGRIVRIVTVVGLFAGGVTAAELPRLSIVHGFGENHPVHHAIQRFRDNLAGMATVELGIQENERATIRALLNGEVDAAVLSPADLQEMVREITVLDLIGLWRDRAHWARALDGEPGRQLASLVERATQPGGAGFQVLGFWGGTRRHLLTRRDGVRKTEALASLRLRIPINPVRSKMWKALGVQPVLLPGTEVSAALRDGRVDGLEEEAEVILQTRLFELAPHLTETGHAIGTRLFLITRPAWGRLTKKQQAAVAAAQKAAAAARAGEQAREELALASLKQTSGVNVHDFTEQNILMARTRPFRLRYADELGISRLLALIEKVSSP